MNTRKFPRTIKEAFGPHSCQEVEPCDPPMTWHDRLIIFVCLVCYVAVIWRIATEVF
jgi:hypothetical protein